MSVTITVLAFQDLKLYIGGSDYDGTSQLQLFTFSPGNIIVSVGIPLVDDSTFEQNETFHVTLEFQGAPPERVTIDPATAVVSIFDDDSELLYTQMSPLHSVFENKCNATINYK